MREEWEPIEENMGYVISDQGRVEDLDKERLVPLRTNAQGIVMVTFRRDGGGQHTRSVALLVARAFIPPHRNPLFTSLIHLNGDRRDCRAENLMWRTRPFALAYHAMFNSLPLRYRVRVVATGESFNSLRDFCTTYGVIEAAACRDIHAGRQPWPFPGFVEFLDD